MIPDELAHLGLEPHPEGGFFRETFRSRHLTTIDFLLPAGGYSAWHQVRGSDEVWNHHRGGELVLHVLSEQGYQQHSLGQTTFSAVVPAGAWQAAEAPQGWVLVGCTVAPPFDFARFSLATPALVAAFPDQRELIRRLLPK